MGEEKIKKIALRVDSREKLTDGRKALVNRCLITKLTEFEEQ